MRIIFLFLFLLVNFYSIAQEQTVGLFFNDSRSFNGYTLFSPGPGTVTYLIDNCGRQVNSWVSSHRPNNSAYLLENGNLLRTCQTVPSQKLGGKLEIFNWEGQIIWSYVFGAGYNLHHDIKPLPNGNILIITNDSITPSQAILAGRIPELINGFLLSEKIIEIEPVGTDQINIIWEWSAWDHLIQDYDSESLNYGVVSDHFELLNVNYFASTGPNALTDWLHFNSVAYNSDLDQILISSRNLCEIYIIDHSTSTLEASGHTGGIYGKGGDLLYRYGNPMAYDRGDISDRMLFFQHDAHWIPNNCPDAGKISVFNNQIEPDRSAVCFFTPPTETPGFYTSPGNLAYRPDNFDWEYISADIYSPRISGAQQLPNGNVLICAGTPGKFYEVDTDGNQLWHYINPVTNSGIVNQGETPSLNNVFKIERYAPDFAAFIGLDLIPGLPVENNPWPSDCIFINDTIATIDVKTFLEGPFNGLQMNPAPLESLPLTQPFNIEPWFYQGTEKVDQIPGDVVDWLLLELRDAETAELADTNTLVNRQAVFLKNDGSIVGLDGFSKPIFYNSIVHNLFVVIYHRNHLGILSSIGLHDLNMNITHDFTLSADATYGGILGIKELVGGKWGMIAGDGNSDNVINQEDEDLIWKVEAGSKGYLQADYNLDFQVENQDKNESFNSNLGKQSQVPQ